MLLAPLGTNAGGWGLCRDPKTRQPASEFAKRRTASEKGRTRKVEINSIGVTRMYRAFGTPGGNSAEAK